MLLLLAGCYVQVHSATCRTDSHEVGLDDPIPGLDLTAGEVLAVIEGDYAFDAAYDDGSPVAGGGALALGEGPILVTERTYEDHVTRGPWRLGGGDQVLTMAVSCRDEVEIPVEGTFATDDGAYDFTFTGAATPEDVVDGVPERVDVTTWLEPSLWLGLQWRPDGFNGVSLASTVDDDYVQILD